MEITPLEMTPVKMSAQSHLGENKVEEPVKSFGEFLTDALKKTNELQLESEKMNAALAGQSRRRIASHSCRAKSRYCATAYTSVEEPRYLRIPGNNADAGLV